MASTFEFAKIGEVFPDTLRVWSLEKVNKNETTNTSIRFHPFLKAFVYAHLSHEESCTRTVGSAQSVAYS